MPTQVRDRDRGKLLLPTVVMEMLRLKDRDVGGVEVITIDRGTITVRRMSLATMLQVIQIREAVKVATHLAHYLSTTMRTTTRENNVDNATGADLVPRAPSLQARSQPTLCYKEWKSSICKTTRMILDMLVLGHIDMANKSKLEVF